MSEERKNKQIKIVIGVLSVLLAVSLAALAVTFIHNKRIENDPAMVSVPDNLITPENDGETPDELTTPTEQEPPAVEPQTPAAGIPEDNKDTTVSAAQWRVTAASLRLYDKQPEDNKRFEVGNMFPGDSVTHYFRVQVSYSGSVTVRYHADILTGYEKLAEVLKVRIKMLNDNTILYDGLMRDMPESVTYSLTAAGSKVEELYYEITAYLDTSVGNEYQNKDLAADFRWWAEGTGSLEPLPDTGDRSMLLLWAAAAVLSSSAFFVLLFGGRRRKEGEQ